MPRRSGYPRVDEVESRGWGRRAPQSPSSSSFGAPQGNNKIYKCDVVFPSGEARINNKSQTQLPYNKAKDISRLQVISSRTASTTKTHGSVLDATASSYLPRSISRLQVKKAVPQVQPKPRGTVLRTCRAPYTKAPPPPPLVKPIKKIKEAPSCISPNPCAT